MFKSAKIKLTLWYLSILTIITVSFSAFVYTSEVSVASRALDRQRVRLETRFNQHPDVFTGLELPPFADPSTITEIKEETLFSLVVLNLLILGISGALSFFLAGKTLKPIEEMLERQKRFVSDAAHELKTPLTVMKTGLEVSIRDKDMDREKMNMVLADAVEEINKLNTFVNKLLKQSKYQNGLKTMEKKAVKIDEVLAESIKSLELLAKEKNIVIDLNSVSSETYGNREELDELFKNLLENAIKYSPNNEKVTLRCFNRNNDIIIEIIDKGPGISKEDQPKIFDPFFRADRSRQKNKVDGFGLGLAICKEIVENHCGSIHINSEPGKGSTFVVSLPIYKFIKK